MDREDEYPTSMLYELVLERRKNAIPAMLLFQHPKGPPKFRYRQTSILHYAAAPISSNGQEWANHDGFIGPSKDILAFLLSKFSEPHHLNAKDEDGWTPLHVACIRGCDWAVKILLNAGADPYAVDRWGMNPVHHTFSYWDKAGLTFYKDYYHSRKEHALSSPAGRRACKELICRKGFPQSRLGLGKRLLGAFGQIK